MQPPQTSLSILLVDLDPQFTESLGSFLSSRGHRVTACNTAEDAVQRLKSGGLDAALIDSELPLLSSIVQTAHSQRQRAVLIAVGGPLPRGAQDHLLHRPFSGRELLVLLNLLQERAQAPSPPEPCPEPEARQRPRRPQLPPSNPPAGLHRPTHAEINSRTFARVTFDTNVLSIGTLRDTSVSDLLYKLFANKKTGQLAIMCREQLRTLYLLEGVPVAATSDAPSEQIDSILLKLGFLKLPTLQRAREEADGRSLPEALLALDLVTPEQLQAALDRQVAERILHLFALPEGNFAFQEGPEGWVHRHQHFPQNPIELISVGIQRHVPPNLVAQELSSELHLVVNRTSRFEAFLPFLPNVEEQRPLLDLIDGQRTLQELTQRAGARVLELLTLIWTLRQTRMVALNTTSIPDPTSYDAAPISLTPTSNERLRSILRSAPSPNTSALRRNLLKYGLRLESGDAHTILGVPSDASSEALRDAFRAALDAVSPPSGAQLTPDLQRQTRQIEDALKRAYDQLAYARPSGPTRRPTPKDLAAPRSRPPSEVRAARPTQDLQAPRRAPPPLPSRASYASPQHLPPRASAQPPAASPLQLAHEAIAQGRWEVAARHLDSINTEHIADPQLTILKAWTLFNLPYEDKERQRRVCRERIELALSLDATIPEGWYYLGSIAEAHSDPETATRHYKRALQLRPDYPEAQGRLTALDTPRRAAPRPPEPPRGAADGLLRWLKS